MNSVLHLSLIASMLSIVSSTCPNHALLGCVLRLKAQRVPFEKNMLNVVFNIATEAKLLRTCRVYSNTMPCFREKIIECGDEKQKRMLDEVGRMLMFICSPFSLQRQRQLIKHQRCISAVLNLPPTTDCPIEDLTHSRDLSQCRTNCAESNSNFLCTMQTWMSEQNVCTMQSLLHKCGSEAAGLYDQMQVTVFEPYFPIICDRTSRPSTTSTSPSTVVPIRKTSKGKTPQTSSSVSTSPSSSTSSLSSTTPASSSLRSSITTTVPSTPRASSSLGGLPMSPSPSRPRNATKNTMKSRKMTPTTTAKVTTTVTTPAASLEEYEIEVEEEEVPDNTDNYITNSLQSPPKNRSLSELWEVYNVNGKNYREKLNEILSNKMILLGPSKTVATKPPVEVTTTASTSTEASVTSATPRTIKVYNILKRFLPDYIPHLSGIFEQVQESNAFLSSNPSTVPPTTTTSTKPTVTPSLRPSVHRKPFATTNQYPSPWSSSTPSPTIVNIISSLSPSLYSTFPVTNQSRYIHRMMPKIEHRSAVYPNVMQSTPSPYLYSSLSTPFTTNSFTVFTTPSSILPPQYRNTPLFPIASPSLQPGRIVRLPQSIFAAAQTPRPSIRSSPPHLQTTVINPSPKTPSESSYNNFRISYLSTDRATPPPQSTMRMIFPSMPIQAPTLPDFIRNLGNIAPIPAKEFTQQFMSYPHDHPLQSDISTTTANSIISSTPSPLHSEGESRRSSTVRRSGRWRPWYLGGTTKINS